MFRFKHALVAVWLSLPLAWSAAPLIAQDLPGEGLLPGMEVPEASQMPPESELPESMQPGGGAIGSVVEQPEATTPAPSDESALPPASELPPNAVAALPSEGQLPDAATPTGQAPAAPQPPEADGPEGEEPAPAGMPWETAPDAIPWLRLNLQGHVAPVRTLVFSPDGRRILSAGEDKTVVAWVGPGPNDRSNAWRYQRTVRWSVQRGASGRVYTLGNASGLLAIAGQGAMGYRGEVLLLDAATGDFRSALVHDPLGHSEVVVATSFSPDPRRPGLVSSDGAGKVVYWSPDPARGGQWGPRVLQDVDLSTYGAEVARALEDFRGLSPVVMLDGRHAVFPVYVRSESSPTGIAWRLQRVDTLTGAKELLPGQTNVLHLSMVTALARSPSGQWLASADSHNNLYLWDVRRGTLLMRWRLASACLSLAFGPQDHMLALGLAAQPSKATTCEVWNLTDPRRPTARRFSASGHVWTCAISPDAKHFAYNDGNDVIVWDLTSNQPGKRLRAGIRVPLRVAFAKEEPLYRIAIGHRRNEEGNVELSHVFDTRELQLSPQADIDPNAWLSGNSFRFGWEIRTVMDGARPTYWLYYQGQRRGQIPLDVNRDGAFASACWIPDAQRRAAVAVAVGTDGSNNIYLFGLANQGECPVIRVLRGHESAVVSLCASADLRYLVSGSRDATVRVWHLPNLQRDSRMVNRWGAEFEIQNGQLVAAQVETAGPLYFRGLREGDVVTRIRWVDGSGADQRRASSDAAEMLRVLDQIDWREMVAFDYTRGRVRGRAFQIYPAWQQLVSLTVDDRREWAYWSPAGYYDASFEGHRLFGWQINRGLTTLPDFFLAAQLRQALERPETMSRLLEAGNLQRAFELAGADPPASPQRAIVDAYRLKPHVTIVSPDAGTPLEGDVAQVEATILVPAGQQLVPPKAFANGVVAVNRELVSERKVGTGREYTYRWQLRLPSDSRILLQVVAATDSEMVDMTAVELERASVPARYPSRLFLAAAGINQYRDAQIPRLEHAVDNARQLAYTLREASAPLYRTHAVSLADDQVTRAAWLAAMTDYAEALKTRVSPDDLLVIFLSGHGVRDAQTDRYYYLTSNAKYRDVMAGQYQDCLSFEDFSVFADVPCRKLVILDTCHSGAIQPLRQRQLKTALRALQEDLMLTLTASEGSQQAVESRERGLGRFTYRMLEGLRGAADRSGGDGNGVVSWPELVDYVQRSVTADSVSDPYQQFPTAGPSELLRLVDFPVSRAGEAAATAGVSRSNRVP